MLGEKHILQDFGCLFKIREIDADFVKRNNFLFTLYFEMCKNIIFTCMHESNIGFVWKMCLNIFFVHEKLKLWRYDILFCKFELMK